MMNKLTFVASSALLAFSAASFAEGFYIQGGGGAGFINGNIDDYGIVNTVANPAAQTPIIRPEAAVVGSWTAGLGYMFNDSFGLEANYVGYGKTTDTKTKTQSLGAGGVTYNAKLQSSVYQIHVMGVARTPFEVGMGFFVKAKAGVGYTKQELEQTFKSVPTGITGFKTTDTDSSFTPVLSVGLEKELTDMFTLSIDYNAAIDNLVENSAVLATIKINPFDVMGCMGMM